MDDCDYSFCIPRRKLLTARANDKRNGNNIPIFRSNPTELKCHEQVLFSNVKDCSNEGGGCEEACS